MNMDHLSSVEPPSSDGSTTFDSEQAGDYLNHQLGLAYGAVRQSVRRWGFTLLLIGIAGVFIPESYTPYFLVLVFLALLSIFFRSSLVWVVMGVYVLTETVTQVFMGAGWRWLLASAIFVVACFYNFVRFYGIEKAYLEIDDGQGSKLTLDQLGRRLGIAALAFGWLPLSTCFTLLIFAQLAGGDVTAPGSFFNIMGNTMLELVTLGLGFGLASLLTRTKHRLLAVAGIIPGILIWVYEIFSWLYLE